MVAIEPGIFFDFDDFGAGFSAFLIDPLTVSLPFQGIWNLGEEGQGANPSPQFMPKYEKDENCSRNNDAPEQRCPERIWFFFQAYSLHLDTDSRINP